MAGPLLLLNLALYSSMLGFASSSALSSFIDSQQYHPECARVLLVLDYIRQHCELRKLVNFFNSRKTKNYPILLWSVCMQGCGATTRRSTSCSSRSWRASWGWRQGSRQRTTRARDGRRASRGCRSHGHRRVGRHRAGVRARVQGDDGGSSSAGGGCARAATLADLRGDDARRRGRRPPRTPVLCSGIV